MNRRTVTMAAATAAVATCLTAATFAAPEPTAAVTDAARVRTTLPAIQMETTALRVVTAPGGSSLETLGRIPVRVAPGAVTLSPQAPLTDADVTAMAKQAGLGVTILWGRSACDRTRWSVPTGGFADGLTARPASSPQAFEALPPGEKRYVCTRLTSALEQDELVQRFAGRRVKAATRWDSRAADPVTWSSTAGTNAVLTVPFPSAVASRQACAPAKGGVGVRWAWPSATSTPVKGAAGVDRWTLLVRPVGGDGAWREITGAAAGSAARSGVVTGAALRAAGLRPGDHEVVVRAYAHPDDEHYADSAHRWRLTLSDRGSLRCTGTVENTGPRLHSGDAR